MKLILLFAVQMLAVVASPAMAIVGGGDITFSAEGMPPVVYSHEDHVIKAKLKCTECHYHIYTNHAQHKAVGMEGMREGKSCGVCHNGKRAFNVASQQNCAKCHK